MSSLDYDREKDAIAATVFPFDRETVELVKTIPGRNYEASGKRWLIPIGRAGQAVSTLLPAGFKLTDAFKERFPSQEKEEKSPVALPGLRVSELLERVSLCLRRNFPQPLWIVGTVIGYERNSRKVHPSFQIADLDEENNNPISSAFVRIFRQDHERILKRFSVASIDFRDELKVLIQVKIEFWNERGEFHLVAIDADPAFTVAFLGRTLDFFHEKLVNQGLAQRNLNREFPLLPLRIGLIAAAESEGFNDFVNELERSRLPFEVIWVNAKMQGPETASSVSRALSRLSKENVDLIALVRGGGAEADLSWFNDFELGKNICLCPVPVLVGIGHHRDRTLPDLVARSEKTPTAVGALLVKHLSEAISEKERRIEARLLQASRKLELAASFLEKKSLLLEMKVDKQLSGRSRQLDRLLSELKSFDGVSKVRPGLLALETRLKNALERGFERSLHHLELKGKVLEGHDPSRQLMRGFAVVTRGGIRVSSLSELEVGADILLRLRDGAARVEVRELEGKEEGHFDG
ncbi:MAG TPA: exodeoxyribonuclease VII large subunit [Cyanobacteria bacterium UBA8530]|nr:exodeoxyribonuclease VII large subunit [Cyanobacteria bacterium UBA8530]